MSCRDCEWYEWCDECNRKDIFKVDTLCYQVKAICRKGQPQNLNEFKEVCSNLLVDRRRQGDNRVCPVCGKKFTINPRQKARLYCGEQCARKMKHIKTKEWHKRKEQINVCSEA